MTLLRIMSAALLLVALSSHAQPRTLDDFEGIEPWSTFAPEGVRVEIANDEGTLRIDYDFEQGGGFAIVRREVDVAVDANYAFDFRVRGQGPPNDLEFKLVDGTGDNVWWHNRRRFAPPAEWTTLTSSRRSIEFAWGPTEDRTLRRVATIELAIASATGGSGTIWIDDLRYTPLPEPMALDAPITLRRASTGEALAEGVPLGAELEPIKLEGDIEIDLTAPRPLGGLILSWESGAETFDYAIQGRGADGQWGTLIASAGHETATDVLTFDAETIDRLRLQQIAGEPGAGVLRSIELLPIQAHESPNALLELLAKGGQRTHLPESYSGQRIFWTVAGLPGDSNEALLDELGSVEPVKGGPRLQPALLVDGELLGGWNATERMQSLLNGWKPIPTASWSQDDLTLTTQLVPVPNNRGFYARYTLTNTSNSPRDASLVLALRPFQILPHWQFLNITGGVSPIHQLGITRAAMNSGPESSFIAHEKSSRTAATAFGSGEILQRLAEGTISMNEGGQISDPAGLASGAWIYDLSLAPGQSKSIDVYMSRHSVQETFDECLAAAESAWNELLGDFWLHLPDSHAHLEDSVRASIAYALVNQDGPAIQPGSRTYERTWIRDGSLTTHALLGAGLHENAVGFIDWYAGFLFDNGKAPCVVDHRGADPVDEHDSTGQYIHTLWSCYSYTRDLSLLERHYDRVRRAMGYIRSLRDQRMGLPYSDESAPEHVFYGLVPESISHEGYSAKPMHSYWDDFFILLGISDAANIAHELGHESDAAEWGELEADFRATLADSIALAMQQHAIDYIPGCAELGDFDATSTAIAAFPVGELASLPKEAVDATFDRYWKMFTDRRDGLIQWRDYTPYEVRVIGAMSDMGEPGRAHEMIDYFLTEQTPTGWRQWPEVVHREVRGPGFIGDLPHSWVACDFVNSISAMLVSVDRDATRVTLARGLRPEWLVGEGIRVENLSTALGRVSWSARREGDCVTIDITHCERLPEAGIWLDLSWLPEGASVVDAAESPSELRINELPARIEIEMP